MTTSALRTRALSILTGTYGTSPWALAAGHFHAVATDVTEGEEALNVYERSVEVEIRDRGEIDGPTNPLNGYGLFRYPVNVLVGYVLTGAGGDDPERAGQQSGAATMDAVEDRAQVDRHLVESILGYYGNWSGTDPAVIDCRPMRNGGGLSTSGNERAVLSVPFEIWARAAIPGAYGPTL